MKATLILAALFAPAAARTLVQPSLARLRGGAIMTPKESYHSYAGKGKVVAEMAPEKSFAASAHAGLIVGFGALLAVGVASGISGLDAKASRIAFGFTFPYILFVILQAGGQLYTGNVGSVMSAYFEGLVPASSILRPLAVSFAGNMVGAVGFAFVAKHLALITPHVGALAAKMAEARLATPLGLVFGRAVVCNWLVCLAIFLAGAADDAMGKLISGYLPITAFIIIGLEHSVANAFLLPLGMFGGADTTLADIFKKNILPVAAGNAVGAAALISASYSYQFGKLGGN